MKSRVLLVLFIFAQARADSPREKTAFEQALEQNQMVQTEERIVTYDGRRYREVSYENKKFYYRFLEKEDSIEVDCAMDSKLTPSLAEVGINVYKRTRVFVQLLSETCMNQSSGRTQRKVVIDPRIGISIPDSPQSTIKNKKVYLGPSGPGFSGEW